MHCIHEGILLKPAAVSVELATPEGPASRRKKDAKCMARNPTAYAPAHATTSITLAGGPGPGPGPSPGPSPCVAGAGSSAATGDSSPSSLPGNDSVFGDLALAGSILDQEGGSAVSSSTVVCTSTSVIGTDTLGVSELSLTSTVSSAVEREVVMGINEPRTVPEPAQDRLHIPKQLCSSELAHDAAGIS
jgi:hypothetical protein